MTLKDLEKLDPATTAVILDCTPVEMKLASKSPIDPQRFEVEIYLKLEELILKKGVETFVSTFSKGFAITAGMALLKLQKRCPQIRIITLRIPHFVNEKYCATYLRHYAQILAHSHRITALLSPTYSNTPTTRQYAQQLLKSRTPNHLHYFPKKKSVPLQKISDHGKRNLQR